MLEEAIRGSKIAIVLLSKNYASSTWCLDELVEIIKCREKFGQKVMAIFYEVDPTDIKKQTGDFGKVFKTTCRGKTKDNIRRWKHALAEVATIAGYHSRNWKNEAEMIEEIATDVSNKLNNSTPSSDFNSLVGMESRMLHMESLLRLDSKEVRVIGIWGPPGIGKTTIARFLFNQHSKDFQLSVFMENIRATYPKPASSDDYSVKKYLQEQFMSQITNQKDFKIPHLGIVEDRLKDKKVLVVLDDVDQLIQLQAMAKETCWFGPWSRIIITTQDQQLLRASRINHVYKVDFPSSHEALQIFCTYAFDQKFPKDGFKELAREVTYLAGSLPLGLRIMGSYFRGIMFKEEWEKALPRLWTRLDGKIESILKFSYDALCYEDKKLFLHIACFFNYEYAETVEGCLANSLTQGLHVLAEKSLISKDPGRMQMDSLLVQLGIEIVQNQSHNKPWKRQFLVDARDIGEVFSNDKADSSSVIGIKLDLSDEKDIKDIIYTSKGAFKRLSNLQFLTIYDDNDEDEGNGDEDHDHNDFPPSLDFISEKLRFLRWRNFPMTCFPYSFHPKYLVNLDMAHSKLEKLWEGIQPLNNLKWMNLSCSKRLKELCDLSTASNLEILDLSHCSSLVKLPSSIGNVINLQKLGLSHCSSLEELPSSIGNAINLQKLDLSWCSGLEELPFSIGNAINLQELNLIHCSSLVNLPSSIGNAINLQKLYLSHCSSLVNLPSSIGNAINLQKLYLSWCSGLEELSFSIGNAINLQELDLSHCSSLMNLPSSIGNAINLQELDLSDCSSLVELPTSTKNLCGLRKLALKGCSKLEVLLTDINFESLIYFDLSGCSSLKSYPEASMNTEGLELSGTAIKEVMSSSCEIQELRPWIGRISSLRVLVLDEMKKLVSLPQLPYSISELRARNCESLERLDCSFRNPNIRLDFSNCFKLNQEARDLIIHTPSNTTAVLPGGEVPECFTYRASGSCLTVKLNQMPLRTSAKFKACLILDDKDTEDNYGGCVDCSITSKQNALTDCTSSGKILYKIFKEHLYIFEVEAEEVTSTELVFEFRVGDWEIKECGILQID